MQRTNPDPAVLAHKIRDLLDEMYPDPAWEDHMRVCRELADAREQINTLTGELDMVAKKLFKALGCGDGVIIDDGPQITGARAYLNNMGVQPDAFGVVNWIDLQIKSDKEFNYKYARHLIDALILVKGGKP